MAALRSPSPNFTLPTASAILLAAGAAAVTIAADPAGSTPRPLMRLPGWIESLHGPETKSETPLRQEDRAAAPAREAAPVRQDATPMPAVLQATDNPRGGALPRTAATWSDVRPVRSGQATPQPTTPATAPAEQAAATPGTNPLKKWLSERIATLPKPAALMPQPRPAPETVDAPARAVDPAPAEDRPEEAAATVTAPVAATPDEMPTLSIDPASFRGVFPGKTTREEVNANWGAGEVFTREDGDQGMFWKIEPFDRVEVSFAGDKVTAIRIKLADPVAVTDLARQLEIADLRTVSILDEQGVSIGEVYPERGVILSVKPGTQAASAIMIEPLDPESFVLRAEGEMETCSANAVADLLYAIQLDPQHVRAHRLLLAMTSEQGKWTQGLRLAETARKLDPADVWTQIKHAGVLLALDRPAEARSVLEAVKSQDNTSPLVTAQVQRLLGRADLAGDKADHQAAVEHFADAIRRASALTTKRSPAVQAAAAEVMLDAHLGTALAIAKGTWQQKSRVIPKWITRAETLVGEYKGSETEKLVLELQLCRGALAAAAGSAEAIEPMPWVKRLLELRDRMGEEISDPWRRRQIDWEVGQGLGDALAAAQKRGDASDMLENCTLTAAYLERGAEHRELTAAERRSCGELLFRIGIMHSLQRGDHATAVTWFDRAIPLWEEETGQVAAADPGRLGESYVSMAISYWQVERREDALALSRRGVELMVAAVDGNRLEERALAVAYGNLSTMYAESGDEDQSRTYAEMASRAEATGTTLR